MRPHVSVAQKWDKFAESVRLINEPAREEISDLLGALSVAATGKWITWMQWKEKAAA